VVSAAWDEPLKIGQPTDGSELRVLEGHTGNITACAVSPDAAYAVSVSRDRTLKLWSIDAAKELATVPLQGELGCVALHPYLPLAACGDRRGNFHLLDLYSIGYGPIVVTAADQGGGLAVHCPACRQQHRLDDARLGEVIHCPTPSCDLRLRVNSFVLTGTASSAWR
jgi:WD40 repeat protein